MHEEISIPSWYQLRLLTREVEPHVIKTVINSLNEEPFPFYIDAVGMHERRVKLLGTRWESEFIFFTYTEETIKEFSLGGDSLRNDSFRKRKDNFINNFSARKRREVYLSNEYNRAREEIMDSMLKKFEALAEPVRIFQGSLEEITREVGREVENVPLKSPEAFLKEEDSYAGKNANFWLRVKTALYGGNFIAHYNHGSAIGTPVRYKTEKPLS